MRHSDWSKAPDRCPIHTCVGVTGGGGPRLTIRMYRLDNADIRNIDSRDVPNLPLNKMNVFLRIFSLRTGVRLLGIQVSYSHYNEQVGANKQAYIPSFPKVPPPGDLGK